MKKIYGGHAANDTGISARREGGDLVIETSMQGRFAGGVKELIESIFAGAPDKIIEKARRLSGLRPAEAASALSPKISLAGFFESRDTGIYNDAESAKAHGSVRLVFEYEDDFIAVLNKPAGIKIHPDREGDADNLCAALDAHFHASSERSARAYPIHRLDIGTSGLIVFAKDSVTCAILDRALFENRIERRYTAAIDGLLKKREGEINLAIGRDRHVSNKYRVSPSGKPAVTRYKLLCADSRRGISLVEAVLETGRTHQIRVHFSHIGHPLCGDSLYGSRKSPSIGREFLLHSSYVKFTHPYNKKTVELSSAADFMDPRYPIK